MPIKYLCLDDEEAKVKPIVELIENANSGIKIDVRTPTQFDDEIRQLGKSLFDGLLLDLRLDRTADEDGNRVNYRALSLAQELRTRMTEGEIGAFPIVLWSVDDNFKVSYDRDETGHDLFDALYFKGTINGENRDVAGEMIDLAIGYQTISRFKSRTVKKIYSKLINLNEEYDVLDPRIASEISEDRKFPAHIFARSILRNLVLMPGPLVGEQLLAARLGIDITKSSDWPKLLSKLVKIAGYTGVFGTAWPRWWMFKIMTLWDSIHPAQPLQRLIAADRVAVLSKIYRLKGLQPATALVPEYDTKFWHVCKFYDAPIAPSNSVQLSVDRREWQDAAYCSLKAILEREHKSHGYEIHAFERARINELIVSLLDAKK